VPHCRCGKLFREGADAYCVQCGFESRASSSTSGSTPRVEPSLESDLISAELLRSPGEHVALLVGAGLFVASWLVFDIATDAIPLLVVSLGLIVYVLYQQGAIKGSSLAVTPRSFPEVDALARSAAVRLGTKKSDLFIKQSYELNAFALGILGHSCVVLHSATVHALTNTPKELQFIIGHELTHIKCSHVLWQTIAARNPILGRIPILNYVLPLFFSWWSRQAEYTADRGGLIACRDLAASQRALARLVIGPDLFHRLNMEEFIKQAKDGDLSTKASELLSTHPLLAKRLLALAEFAQSPLGAGALKADASAASARG
jgi:Zn-dependent protease with chaperone function